MLVPLPYKRVGRYYSTTVLRSAILVMNYKRKMSSGELPILSSKFYAYDKLRRFPSLASHPQLVNQLLLSCPPLHDPPDHYFNQATISSNNNQTAVFFHSFFFNHHHWHHPRQLSLYPKP